MGMGTCRSCGVSIVWAKSASGRAVPLDAVSPSEGNIRVGKDGITTIGKVGSGPYRAHFATCPQAEMWRRGKPNGGAG